MPKVGGQCDAKVKKVGVGSEVARWWERWEGSEMTR